MAFRGLRSRISRLLHSARWGRSVVVLVSVSACGCPSLLGQAVDRPGESANKSWTTTTDSQIANWNPTRTIESHSQSGNRTLDTQSIQRRGFDGRFEPYLDVEKETLQVDTNTVRTVTRTYARDANGAKTLQQVTEEEKHTLPDGGSNVARATSNADTNGRLELVQREIEETRQTRENVEERQKTVLLPSVNGGLAPTMKVQERRTRGADDTLITETTRLVPDGAGNWQVGEVRQATERGGNNSAKEEKVSRPDAEGNMGEVSHTVTRQAESPSGDKFSTVETYSVDVPGTARDGGLHLVERATTVQHVSPTGQQTTRRQVEQLTPGDPTSGLRVMVQSTSTLRPDSSGAQGTQTIQMRDANGTFGTVSVDMSKSSDKHILQVQMPPSDKTKLPADKSK